MQKYLILLFFCLLACRGNEGSERVSIMHLESLYELDANELKLDSLKKEFGYFWEIYCHHIIPLAQDSSVSLALIKFQHDSLYQSVYNDLKKTFEDFDVYERELTEVLLNYRYYFPERITPSVITFYGAFNYPVVALDSVIGIGLEMFLGKDYYSDLSQKYPPYMHQQFQPAYMTALAVKGWLETEFPSSERNFLTQIVHKGKLHYILSELMEECPDSILMGYSKQQIEWCEGNEFSIWQFLINEDLLYTNKQEVIIKYIGPAPFSRGMPRESPGRASVWVGWQIVKAYMQRYPNTSFQELMAIQDAQYLLTKSKYKP